MPVTGAGGDCFDFEGESIFDLAIYQIS